MERFAFFATCVLTCVFLSGHIGAEDPPKKLTPEERKEREAKWAEHNAAGGKAYGEGRYPDAAKAWQEALELARQLYSKDEYPTGHPNLATSLHFLGLVFKGQGKLAEAHQLYRDALDMRKQLFKSDHPDLALNMNNLALLLQAQGKYAAAEPLFHDALAMRKRLFKGDHADVAVSLNCLAVLYFEQGKYAEAEPILRDVLEMLRNLFKGNHVSVAFSLNNLASVLERQEKYGQALKVYGESLEMGKGLFKGDHPFLATVLSNLGNLCLKQEDLARAEPFLRDSLSMSKRLFKGDHPAVANSLNSLASLRESQGKTDEGERLFREALDMNKRLFKGDHRLVVQSLTNLASCLTEGGKYAEADPLLREALSSHRRLVQTFATRKSEGETLTLIASQGSIRDHFLTNSWLLRSAPSTVYAEVWASKGMVARVYEQRQQQARAAATDSRATQLLVELTAARRRRAELLVAPEPKDPGTRQKREGELQELDGRIAELTRLLPDRLPSLSRPEKLAAATPAELQKMLPPNAAVVDLLRFSLMEYDPRRPGQRGVKQIQHYHAFVVTRDKLAWLDLGLAEQIEPAVTAWLEAITTGKEIPPAIPARVRKLVREKVRRELPASVSTIYFSPDAILCDVPWAALPGDKPGTILLEDFAVATIPHAPFLLDKLWPQEPIKDPPSSVLVVGGVKYEADLAPITPPPTVSPDAPLVKPKDMVGWAFLPATAAEVNGVMVAAEQKKLPTTRLVGDKPTTSAILATLPKAKYAHFATHGFFADPSFRSAFQLNPKDYQRSLRGERIGRAMNSPLVMTGLVFAGANNPKTPGRGILTGESLIDLDLSGLELAVLSACETGLGDVTVGEGTFGLQRAFHLAGTRDVIASLWKVPDQSTAALMALFYRNLWTQNLSPMESLRQAQLEIYRNPAKIAELAKGFRGKFEEVPGSGSNVESKAGKDGKAHPLLWAAFTLSGPGR